MEKLQFDSFYKFLVSIGIAFVFIPFFLLNQLFSGKYDLLISQEQYNELSAYSKYTLSFREKLYIFANNNRLTVYLFLLAMLIAGIITMAIGMCKWYKNQKYLDAQTKYQTEKLANEIEKNMEKSTDSEKVTRIIEMSSDSIIGNSVVGGNATHPSEEKPEPVIETAKIRDAFFKYLQDTYNNNEYHIYQDLKIGQFFYDYIVSFNGRSEKTNDYLIEVKIANYLSETELRNYLQKVQEKLTEFNVATSGDLIPILYLIDSRTSANKDLAEIVKTLQKESQITIKIVALETLKKYMA